MMSWLGNQAKSTAATVVAKVAPEATEKTAEFGALYSDVMRLLFELIKSPRFAAVSDDIQKVADIVTELKKNQAKTDSSLITSNALRSDGGIAGFGNILGDSLVKITAVLMQIGTFPDGASYYNPSTWLTYGNNLFGQVQQLLKLLPILLESYEKLGVSSFLSKTDLSAEAIKRLASDKVSSTLQSTLEKMATYVATFGDIQAIPVVNNITLISMQEMNAAIGKALVYLDGMETSWGLEEGVLFNAMQLQLTFPESSPLAKSALNNSTLKDFCLAWKKDYQERMQKLGYPVNEDTYPFAITIYHERLNLHNSMYQALEETKVAAKIKAQNSAKSDIAHLLTLVNKKIEAISSLGSAGVNSAEGQSYKASLELIQTIQKLTPEEGKQRLLGLFTEEVKLENTAYSRTIESLTKIYANADKFYNNWLNEKKQAIQQLEEKITRSVDADPTLAESSPFKKEKRYDAILENIKAAIEDAREALAEAKSIINDLTPAHTTAQPVVAEEPVVATKPVLTQIDEYLESIVDPMIYQRFFVKGERTTEQLPLQDIAIALASAKQAIAYLDKVKTDVTFQENMDAIPAATVAMGLPAAAINEFTTPSQALAKTTENARGIVTATKTLIHAIQLLKTDPLTSEYVTSIQLGYSKAKESSLAQYLIGDTTKKINDIHASQQTILGKLLSFYDKIKDNPDFTQEEREAMIRAETRIRDLHKQTAPYLEAGTLTFKKSISLIFKNLSLLTKLKDDFLTMLFSLQKVSQENLIALLEQINLLLKNTYLLLDSMDGEIGLKEKALTHDIRIASKSLVDIITEYEKIADRYDYPLTFADRYAYPKDVLKQREQTLARINPVTDPIKHQLATERVAIKKHELNQDKARYIESLKTRAAKDHAINLINNRVDELQRQLKVCYFFSRPIKNMKISLLTVLKNGLKNKSYDEMIETLKTHKGFKQYIHGILDGRTAEVLQKIETGKLSPTEMASCVQEVIKALEKDLSKTFLFFTSKDTVHERIAALTALKETIIDPKKRLTDRQVELLTKYDSATYNKFNTWLEIRAEQVQLVKDQVKLTFPEHSMSAKATARAARRRL